MEREKYLIDFLKQEENYYLTNDKKIKLNKAKEILSKDFILYHIKEITFEEKSPRKEAFENVISSLRIEGINFVYLLLGDETGVHFYFGIVKNLNEVKDLDIDIDDIGKDILKSSIEGNFRGSKVRDVGYEKNNLKQKISDMRYFGRLEGVPGINEDNENIQGVDRLVDVMLGDVFGVSIISSPVSQKKIMEIEEILYKAYDKLSPLAKKSVQENESKSSNVGKNKTDNVSETTGTNTGKSKTFTEGKNETTNSGETKSIAEGNSTTSSSSSTSKTGTKGTNTGKSLGINTSEAVGENTGTSHSKTTGVSIGENSSEGITRGNNISVEFSDKSVVEWIKYLDDVIFPRIDYGKSKGLFTTNIFLFAEDKSTLIKLGNTMKALFSGTNGNKVPLSLRMIEDEEQLRSLKNLQFPSATLKDKTLKDIEARFILSQNINSENFSLGNWMSTNELSLIAGLPQKEVVGLSLKEEIEFGLNPSGDITDDEKMVLGKLVRSGNKLKIPVAINKSDLDKHTFITGVTGSGKTTTCLKMLLSSKMPFMVIEPAKTEYRILTKKYDDLLIFTLGNDSIAPFRLNPFEFFPHENIASRVDMIKASIESAFDMEAAIPQIIEAAIYRCYENFGWNIATNKNRNFETKEEAFAEGIYSFPTLEDLIKEVEVVAEEQGFDERLKKDYIGSIKARLQGLLIGSKGLMLNTRRSLNFKDLVNKKVILELEEIRNGNEKSLIIGFILTNLNEAIKACYLEAKHKGKEFKHITLIEEAHRLLSRYENGDSPNKKQGVEVFSDMLAEVRKYGEALIIVDQIPNKLTPEVLKNTNTKIVHKIFAKDDKEAIGNTMALEDEQKNFLSYLETGRAIISSQGFSKPIQVQIEEIQDLSTTNSDIISENEIRKNAIKYYQKNYKTGVIQGLEKLGETPTFEEVESFIKFIQEDLIIGKWKKAFLDEKIDRTFDFKKYIEQNHLSNKLEFLADYIGNRLYKDSEDFPLLERKKYILEFLETGKYGLYCRTYLSKFKED